MVFLLEGSDAFIAAKVIALVVTASDQDDCTIITPQPGVSVCLDAVRTPPSDPSTPLSDLVNPFSQFLTRLSVG